MSTEPIAFLPVVEDKPVALTFDDGPDPVMTPRIVETLVAHGVTATFFVVGERAAAHGDVVRSAIEADMAIGVHGWDHADLRGADPAVVADQLARALGVVTALGSAPQLFRPPYGRCDASLFETAAALGLATIGWSVDTEDWRQPGPDAIVDVVRSHARPGSIVLLHDGGGDRSQTLAALPGVIAALKGAGLDVVDLLGQLLA